MATHKWTRTSRCQCCGGDLSWETGSAGTGTAELVQSERVSTELRVWCTAALIMCRFLPVTTTAKKERAAGYMAAGDIILTDEEIKSIDEAGAEVPCRRQSGSLQYDSLMVLCLLHRL